MVKAVGGDEICLNVELDAVERDALGNKPVAVERQIGAAAPLRIGADQQPGHDARRMRVKHDVEFDRIDQVIRRPIIGETDRLGEFGAHQGLAWMTRINERGAARVRPNHRASAAPRKAHGIYPPAWGDNGRMLLWT